MNRFGIVFLAAVVLLATACKEGRGPRSMSGTYQVHDNTHITMLTFVDERHLKWDPGSENWLYLVVGDTVLMQNENSDALIKSVRFLIRGDSLVFLLNPSLVFVRTR